ncbi:MAG: tripartite tricarboxylate transporter TctB family protein [Burkholderiaceae bacterium]
MKERLRLVLPYGVMLLATGWLYYAATLIDAPGGLSATRIGPDFWPKTIIGAMAVLCIYEIAKRLMIGAGRDAGGLTEGLDRPPATADGKQIEPDAPVVDNRKLAAGLALIAGFVIGVVYLGFVIATALFLALFSWVGGYRRALPVALVSVLGAFILLVIFMRVAYVSLPLGIGPFHSLSVLILRLIGV